MGSNDKKWRRRKTSRHKHRKILKTTRHKRKK
ncbi:MAG: 30S ribosomal protein bS22 [Candidatus Woesearchaeota archaeon]